MSASSFPDPGDIHSHPDAELDEIKRSSAWRLIRSLWRLRLWFVPHGGMREVALVWAKWAIAAVRSEGPIRMLREARPTILAVSARIRRDRTASFAIPSDSPRRFGRWYPTPRCFRVLIVNGVPDTDVSAHYRVFNLAEALLLAGIHASAINETDLPGELPKVLDHDVLVLFRVKWDDRIEQLISLCHECNIPVIFDIDDYLFDYGLDPERYAEIVPGWSDKELAWYVDMVLGYHRTLGESDFFTGSTHYLVERASALGKESFVIRNGLSWELIEIARGLRLTWRAESDTDQTTIVYLSGTNTHERDFNTVVPALLRIFEERADVELMVVGYLDLARFSELKPYRNRIQSHPFLPWRELPGLIAGADINIAPLELAVPFSDAKSELKYFEAGALELVTVASATDTYERAIKDGETGLLCRTSQDWYRVLSMLIENPQERARLAEGALHDSMANYSPAAVAAEAEKAYKAILRRFRELNGLLDEQLQIGWVISGTAQSVFWYERIFMVADGMAKGGHGVVLYFLSPAEIGDEAEIRGFAERHLGEAPAFHIVLGTEAVLRCDALIATDPITARFVAENREKAFVPTYFVQDYAPLGRQLEGESFGLEDAFKQDFFVIAQGEALAKVLTSLYARAPAKVSYWIDRDQFYPRTDGISSKHQSSLLFYVPNDMSEMNFRLGAKALSAFLSRYPEVKVVLLTETALSNSSLELPFEEVKDLAPLERGNLFRQVDLCISSISTIPSPQISEMMACGLPVLDLQVDFRTSDNRIDMMAVEIPSPEEVAQELSSIVEGDNDRLRMSAKAIERASQVADRETALGELVSVLESEIRTRGGFDESSSGGDRSDPRPAAKMRMADS